MTWERTSPAWEHGARVRKRAGADASQFLAMATDRFSPNGLRLPVQSRSGNDSATPTGCGRMWRTRAQLRWGLPNVRTRAPKVARASQPWQEVTAPLELPRASPTWQATELRPPPRRADIPTRYPIAPEGEIKTGVSTRTDTRRQNREPGEKLRAAFASLAAFPAWKVIFRGKFRSLTGRRQVLP